jgi:hypothetical protein
MLAFESQQVVALRLMHLANGGPSALREAERMVSEKVVAAVESAVRVSIGQGPDHILRSYRRKVQANRDRLTCQPYSH